MKKLNSNITIILIINGLLIALFSLPVRADHSGNNKLIDGQNWNRINPNNTWEKDQSYFIKTSNSFSRLKDKVVKKHKKLVKKLFPRRHNHSAYNSGHNNSGSHSNSHNNSHNSGNHNNSHYNNSHNNSHQNSHNNGRHNQHQLNFFYQQNYSNNGYRRHRHDHFQALWYNTHYLAPIHLHFNQIGHVVHRLPHKHRRIKVAGIPYFYFSGVFYKHFGSSYIVVSAPIGARITALPTGFIGFNIGQSTYYTINDNYYVWDDFRDCYFVVDEPVGATTAIRNITRDRLTIEPLARQNAKQQAKDRYACHRWAVSESNVDPTDEDQKINSEENIRYKSALSACMQDRNYSVKET